MAVLDKTYIKDNIDPDVILLARRFHLCPAVLSQSYLTPAFAQFVERNLMTGRSVRDITDVLWPQQVKMTMNLQEGHLFSDARQEMDKLACTSFATANS